MRVLRFDKGRKIWITSDTHYRHRNIIKYCMRPWLSDEERIALENAPDERAAKKIHVSDETLKRHDEGIVARINEKVGPDDVLIHGGDVAWGTEALEDFADLVNCDEVYVLIGNHDDEFQLKRVFGSSNVFERVMVEVGRQRAIIDHYPADTWDGSHHGNWHLYGHVHGVGNERRRLEPSWALSIDVGVDSHDYYPWDWYEELLPLFAGRKKDWDDWRKRLRSKEQGGMRSVGAV